MDRPQPPMARRVPKTQERFGLSWRDDWAWLRDPLYPKVEDPEILAYLKAENAYVDALMAPEAGLIRELQDELKSRLKEDESSVPVEDRGFLYHWSYPKGSQYRVWYRQALGQDAVQTVLDENALAAGKPFFALRGMSVSPDGQLLAIATDEDGSERFRLSIREIASGRVLEEGTAHLSGTVAWSEDGQHVLYVELNENLRPFRVRAHRLGDDPVHDRTIFEEADPAFFVSLGRTQDRAYFVIAAGTHVTSECHVLPTSAPLEPSRCVAPRHEGHQYELDHAGGYFWLRTNDRHENFRLVRAPAADPGQAHWKEVIAGSDAYYFLGLTCFADFMVLEGRANGLAELEVRDYQGQAHKIEFPEAVGTPALGDNRLFVAKTIRLSYSSMVTPGTVFDYDVQARQLITRKVQEIPRGYDKDAFRTTRLTAPGHDGVGVPVTLVYPKDYPTDGTGRLHLYGYGAYGHGMDPSFSPHRLTLLERGFAFAIAHVRGGDELGWRWYEDGKLEKKENSFKDFIAAAEHLIAEGWAAKGRIAIRGGSAGGMLMGAVANMRPDLWNCVIAEVPFVDVVNTMSDPSLPLTPIEWPEWGNPIEDEAALRRMLAYSPYDGIKAQDYPAMLVTAGISDPRVTYWEPAKFVARLRATQTSSQPLLFKTVMEGGHFGRSGRYDALAELALHYAFMLRCYGLTGDAA